MFRALLYAFEVTIQKLKMYGWYLVLYWMYRSVMCLAFVNKTHITPVTCTLYAETGR
jgi:hypothetical protein